MIPVVSPRSILWGLQLDEGIYNVRADIPAGTLSLQRDGEDAITLPLGTTAEPLFTPAGLPARDRSRGLLIGKDRKVLRND